MPTVAELEELERRRTARGAGADRNRRKALKAWMEDQWRNKPLQNALELNRWAGSGR